MKILKFQEGGAAPAPEQGGAPAQGGQGGPEEQLAQVAQQIIQQFGPEASAMLAEIIMQMLQGAAQQAPQGNPVYAKKGGKLVLVNRR